MTTELNLEFFVSILNTSNTGKIHTPNNSFRLTAEQALNHPFFDVDGHNLEGGKVETLRKGLRRFKIAGLVKN